MQANGEIEAHISERVTKTAGVVRRIGDIGKKRLKKDWNRRIKLFDALAWPVLGYGAELWGWKERKGTER